MRDALYMPALVAMRFNPDLKAKYLELLAARRVEDTLPKNLINGACLLCSEPAPHHCHRRLAAEYLQRKWGDVEIEHL